MASFPLYDTFFYYFTQKSSLFVQLFRKKWEKNWASTKSCLTPPLRSLNFTALISLRFCYRLVAYSKHNLPKLIFHTGVTAIPHFWGGECIWWLVESRRNVLGVRGTRTKWKTHYQLSGILANFHRPTPPRTVNYL